MYSVVGMVSHADLLGVLAFVYEMRRLDWLDVVVKIINT